MYKLLSNLRVVEASSFVASPSAGLYLAQMGAEVIRIDQIGGGPDFGRWPKNEAGASFYWESLNKGKKSVALDLGSPEGRELAQRLAAAPGERGGLFLTNFPVGGFLSHDALKALREDIITVRIMGRADGGPALDYTVNAAVGIPQITGPKELGDAPVNHVLAAWDLLTGSYAAFAMLAAERHRAATGAGQEVLVPLQDMAITSVANMGMLAEVLDSGENRERLGNEVYGAFGRDFETADGKRLIVMAITPRQWTGLVEVLGIAGDVAGIEAERGVSFDRDEGLRFEHRDALMPLVASSIARRESGPLIEAFEANGVCWGGYQMMREAADDPDLVRDNPVFSTIDNPSGFSYPQPGAAARFGGLERQPPEPAHRLGADSEEVLSDALGLSSGEIGKLVDNGIVGTA
ncbi:MAG: carnitine dehydratase [Sphingomonadaceae bacterium]|nr:carnitine dehydratase [Sphingomonadaceae bacterium]